MTAKLTELIVGRDASEVVRDEIAAILAVELAEQQTLAIAEAEDPDDYNLRVFLERAHPWHEFQDAPDPAQAFPIVNVALESVSYDESGSNTVESQKAQGLYYIDCYGYGVSEDDGGTGHTPGDEMAALEAQRALRLVRRVLMAGPYTYLGLRPMVTKRWPQSVQAFQPQLGTTTVQNVVAVRLALAVTFYEHSPQYVAETLELVSTEVKRSSTGEIFLTAQYDVSGS